MQPSETLESSLGHRRFTALKSAVLVVLGAHIAGGIGWKAILAAICATILWRALYYINEGYDWGLEKGLWPKAAFFRNNYLLLSIPLIFSLLVDPLIFIFLVIMAVFELLYCHRLTRLKQYVLVAPILSGILGPTLRFGLGVFTSTHSKANWPLILACWALLLAVHLPGALKSRVFRRLRDRQLGYQAVTERFARVLRPFQFLTPLGVFFLGIILEKTTASGLFPRGTILLGLLSASFLATATWALNNFHDFGDEFEVKTAVKILHEMWRLRFETKQPGISLVAGALIVGLWAFAAPVSILATSTASLLFFYRARTYNF